MQHLQYQLETKTCRYLDITLHRHWRWKAFCQEAGFRFLTPLAVWWPSLSSGRPPRRRRLCLLSCSSPQWGWSFQWSDACKDRRTAHSEKKGQNDHRCQRRRRETGYMSRCVSQASFSTSCLHSSPAALTLNSTLLLSNLSLLDKTECLEKRPDLVVFCEQFLWDFCEHFLCWKTPSWGSSSLHSSASISLCLFVIHSFKFSHFGFPPFICSFSASSADNKAFTDSFNSCNSTQLFKIIFHFGFNQFNIGKYFQSVLSIHCFFLLWMPVVLDVLNWLSFSTSASSMSLSKLCKSSTILLIQSKTQQMRINREFKFKFCEPLRKHCCSHT